MAPIPASTGPVSIGPLHSPDCTAWRAAAFGVEVEAAFAVLGIAPDRNGAPVGSVPGKRVRLELTESGDLDARWQGASPARLFMQPDENGQPWVTLEHDRSTGFMVWTADFGRYLVSSDGRQLVTAPPPVPPAVWQRMLVGHAIPLAGVLQGLELLHASAVAL